MPYCYQCGNEISMEHKFCGKCGARVIGNLDPQQRTTYVQSASTANQRPFIENHLAKAILVTLFCCLPLGIVSIVYAASVDGKLQAGDIEGARLASEKANMWANWGLGIGLTAIILYIFIYLAAIIISG